MLYYKRLESGTFDLPGVCEHGEIEINWETLMLIINGIRIEKIKRKKRYKKAG
jgi:hypothetical protein